VRGGGGILERGERGVAWGELEKQGRGWMRRRERAAGWREWGGREKRRGEGGLGTIEGERWGNICGPNQHQHSAFLTRIYPTMGNVGNRPDGGELTTKTRVKGKKEIRDKEEGGSQNVFQVFGPTQGYLGRPWECLLATKGCRAPWNSKPDNTEKNVRAR